MRGEICVAAFFLGLVNLDDGWPWLRKLIGERRTERRRVDQA